MKKQPLTKLDTERMLEVQLRLAQLFEREEAAVKVILTCLYDVGSANFIEKKIRPKPVRWVLRPVARLSKPLVRFVGWRWFKVNCPELLADWLYEKVLFEALTDSPVPPEELLETEPNLGLPRTGRPTIERPKPLPIPNTRPLNIERANTRPLNTERANTRPLNTLPPPNALTQSTLAKLETQNLEIQKLHGRVRWLTGFSVGALAMTAGLAFLVLGSSFLPEGLLPIPSTQRSLIESVSPRN